MDQTAEPTKERLRKATSYDRPEVDQQTNRSAYRVHDAFTVMQRKGQVTMDQHEAGQKFMRHYVGSQGVDVRSGDGADGADVLEYPRTYHAQKIAQAESALMPYEFQALERLVLETGTPLSIGFGLTGYANRGQALAHGIAVIRTALDRLCFLWGLRQRQHPPNSR